MKELILILHLIIILTPPQFSYYGTKTKVTFSGSCLKQHNNATYNHGTIVNI